MASGKDGDAQWKVTGYARAREDKLAPKPERQNRKDLILLKRIIESGKVTPVIDRTYPRVGAPEAIRYLAEGHAQGKVVLTV